MENALGSEIRNMNKAFFSLPMSLLKCLKKPLPIRIVAYLLCMVFSQVNYAQNSEVEYLEDDLGWQLGVQTYTFKEFTFFEAVDKIKSAGAKYLEAYPGQELGGNVEGKMDIYMDLEKRKEILKILQEKGVKMLAIGVVSPNTEEDWRQLFEFARSMGIKNINSEPKEEFLELASKLVNDYNISLSIHNHPSPTIYWNPDDVLMVLKKYPNLSVCADIGHWLRSGQDPVESLRKLDGNISHLHVKDLNHSGKKDAHDVVWGTGKSDLKGVIKELKRQGFSGMLSLEYEYNWKDNLGEVTESLRYFRNQLK